MQAQDSQTTYEAGTLPEVFAQVERLEKKLKRWQRLTLRITNLTPPQYTILGLLQEKDALPLKDLAAALFCTRAAITGIVDTLEKKELVQRIPDPLDRRSLRVQLTPKGRQVLQDTPEMGASFTNCCDILQAEDTQTLSRLLKKLNEALDF